MPEFNYRALSPGGEIVTGSLAGDNLSAVRQGLKNEGLFPIEISQSDGWLNAISGITSIKKEINSRSLAVFCRQLSVVIMSGVNLVNGLEIIAGQAEDKKLRAEIQRLNREVQKGRTISEAMGDASSAFPKLLTGMVATGEASGNLDTVLRSMADFYEKDYRVKQRIKSASVYPMVMLLMACGLIAFFFNFLLPQLANLITSGGGELPLLTRIVIVISGYTTRYFAPIALVMLGLFVACKIYFGTPPGRYNRDKVMAGIPMLGKTLRNIATMRFARATHILVKSGVPLLQGLDYVKQNVNNALAEKAVDYAAEGLQRGETLAANLARASYFDPLAIQMFSIGEETGELEKILEEMAEYYDREADAGFTRLLAMVEPAMLIIIGSIVGTVILSVMLPMMDMISNIKR